MLGAGLAEVGEPAVLRIGLGIARDGQLPQVLVDVAFVLAVLRHQSR
ncbi:MAG: hypothetical protein M3Q39_13970 [Actinomycetota bacterium]|nr:hypothetical protein [Actinomycetota bacterium]